MGDQEREPPNVGRHARCGDCFCPTSIGFQVEIFFDLTSTEI